MIQLLYTVIVAEMALVMVLLFKTPLRKLVIMGLDRLKRGRGPIMLKTLAGTVFLVLISSVYTIMKIQKRRIDNNVLNPTDQVVLARHLLEASLLGFFLFLGLMIDRLHHYIREIRLRRKNMEMGKKQNRGFEDGKISVPEETKTSEEEVSTLRSKIEQLESELEKEKKELNTAEANAVALRKQSEGFLLEYDRLLEDNQNLRSQLQSLDWRLSHSGSKKNT